MLNRSLKFMNPVISQNACHDFMEKKSWGTNRVSIKDLILSSLGPLQANVTCIQIQTHNSCTNTFSFIQPLSQCFFFFFANVSGEDEIWFGIFAIKSQNIYSVRHLTSSKYTRFYMHERVTLDMTSNTLFQYLLLLGLIFILESIYYFSSKKS